MNTYTQIAIDGPAAAGKSTIAKKIATKLGYVYIDTGAMYRALTWAAITDGIDLNNEQAITRLLPQLKINLTPSGEVYVNDVLVTKSIRSSEVTNNVSLVASYEAVRVDLKNRQIELARSENVIMDGRDIGTNVLPDADFKFFMVADPSVRALRRYKENLSKGIESDLALLEKEIIIRDEKDATREHAPLKRAEDAILIDTSQLSIDEVVDKMIEYVLK